MSFVLDTNNIVKSYGTKTKNLVLNGITLSVQEGERLAIVGPSGSGKTTLMRLLSAVDDATSGEIWFHGQDICKLSAKERAKLRLESFGFIFQSYDLVENLTVEENVALPVLAAGKKLDVAVLGTLLDSLSLQDKRRRYPAQLSGGEQQRVAIARALSNNPAILFADEATGNLDADNTHRVMQILKEHCEKSGRTLIFVTLDLSLTSYATRVIHLEKGGYYEEN